MKIIYYSDKNDNCVKIINYLNKNNINNLFKIINIDNSKDPKEIKVIQTILNGKNLQHSLPFIIDINLNQILYGGEKVFNYIKNIKYFNNSTNNILNTTNIINPTIKEDDKAFNKDELYVKI